MRWFSRATVSLIAWGVLAFGCEYPWAYAPLLIFASTVGILGLAVPVAAASASRPVVFSLVLIFAAVGLQLCPLPAPVLAALSPARLVQDYTALFAATVPPGPGPEQAAAGGPWSISISPARTLLGAAFLAGLSLFFVGSCSALAAVRASAVVRGVTGVGLLVALVAIVQEASDSQLVYGIWWPRKVETLPAAPLINENHLAGWLVMAFSIAVGYLCGGLASSRVAERHGWRQRVLWLGSRDGSEILAVGLCLLVMAVAVIVTLSVSGIVCLVAVCFVFWSRVIRRSARTQGRLLVPVVLIALPLLAIGWVGFDVVGEELATASWSDVGGRVPIWRDTAQILRDFPITGTGLNTYGIAMLAYQTHRPDAHFVEAHNDYLQLAAEGGLLLGLPILLAVVVFVRQVRCRFREAADDRRIYWLRVGAVAGILALGAQSLVDFSLQMPGNAVLFVLLMAIAVHRASRRVLVDSETRFPCG